MPTAVKEDNAPQLFDRTLEMPELEEHLERYIDTQDAAKEHAGANKKIKEITETLNLTDGERVRVGSYVITGKARSGGGFDVPPWSKVTVGKVTDASS